MAPIVEYAVAAVVAAVASGVNTVAGGGSLISFPVLIFGFGIPSISANATNSVGLWPGSLSGALSFLHSFKDTWPRLKRLLLPTLLGALLGSELLLATSVHVFDALVPILIIFAVGILMFQKRIKAWAAHRGKSVSPLAAAIAQFLVSVYGGYFGAGMGIMMLAAFSLYVEGTLHDYNAIKNWLGMLINFSITFVFLQRRIVVLPVAGAMIVGSIFGGYFAGYYSQKIDPDRLRRWIVAYGLISAAYFVYQFASKRF